MKKYNVTISMWNTNVYLEVEAEDIEAALAKAKGMSLHDVLKKVKVGEMPFGFLVEHDMDPFGLHGYDEG